MTSYGVSLFCDDIREEIGDKQTLVGVYTGDLVIDREFPIVLPRFGVRITLIEPWDEAEGPLNFKIFLPGEKEGEVVVDTDLSPSRRGEAGGNTVDPECIYSQLSFRLSPLLIQREGYIRVRAYKGAEEIKLGSIYVTSKRAETKPNPLGSRSVLKSHKGRTKK